LFQRPTIDSSKIGSTNTVTNAGWSSGSDPEERLDPARRVCAGLPAVTQHERRLWSPTGLHRGVEFDDGPDLAYSAEVMERSLADAGCER